MNAIWYAICIYMIGVAVVLYLRPKTMFRDDGMWKEFGLQKEATIFPFWMFAIVWAVVAYGLATLLSLLFASIVLQSSDSPSVSNVPTQNTSFLQPISQTQPFSPSIPTVNVMDKPPGYYIIDPYSIGQSQPRYIYYGTSPPGTTQ